ncbi:biotin--[acetyl-CoA-carboxylase] ligase [Oscillospiraceae bacterium PP1C4]
MLQKEILYLLEQNKGKIMTGGELAKQFQVSRTAVWKAINTLREDGNEIESYPNSGYMLLENSDGLSEQSIEKNLTTQKLGRTLKVLKTVDSTNQYIKIQDVAALPEGYTVISNEQTNGRGRLGRVFYSPLSQGVYLSILLRPQIALKEVPFLTLCTAVAVCRAIEIVCSIQVGIKWVNDIFYNGKKLCGILTEGVISAEMGAAEYVVIGIGINTGKVAAQVEDIATSIRSAGNVYGARNRLIAEILNQLESIYFDFLDGKKQAILNAYTEKLFIIGHDVTVQRTNESYPATVIGINDSGELLVKNKDGETLCVGTGEIIF